MDGIHLKGTQKARGWISAASQSRLSYFFLFLLGFVPTVAEKMVPLEPVPARHLNDKPPTAKEPAQGLVPASLKTQANTSILPFPAEPSLIGPQTWHRGCCNWHLFGY